MKTAIDYIVDFLLCSHYSIEKYFMLLGLIHLTFDSVDHNSSSVIKRLQIYVEKLFMLFCLLALEYHFEFKIRFRC